MQQKIKQHKTSDMKMIGLEKGMTRDGDDKTSSWIDQPQLAGKTARIKNLFVCIRIEQGRSGLKLTSFPSFVVKAFADGLNSAALSLIHVELAGMTDSIGLTDSATSFRPPPTSVHNGW